MNLPNKLTVFRIAITPVFLIVFMLPRWMDGYSALLGVVLWALYLAIEISDVLDGFIARRYGLVSDLGKVLDPFADVLSRVTYFICFSAAGIMPVVILAILLYREFSVTFLRMILIRKGVAMAASIWGKLKAVTYALAGVLGLVYVSIERSGLYGDMLSPLLIGVQAVFILSAIASVLSFVTYFSGALGVLKETFQE